MQFFLNIQFGNVANRPTVATAFKSLQDGRYMVKIMPYKVRSLQLNKYYHGCVLPLVLDGLREAGFNEIKDVATVHELLKKLFLERKIFSEKNGDEITLPGSTAILTNPEFNQFLDDVRQWAAEYLSIEIPLPNEQIKML